LPDLREQGREEGWRTTQSARPGLAAPSQAARPVRQNAGFSLVTQRLGIASIGESRSLLRGVVAHRWAGPSPAQRRVRGGGARGGGFPGRLRALVGDSRSTPAGPTPAGQTPAGQTPAGQTPAGLTTAGQTTAGQSPAGQTTVGDVLVALARRTVRGHGGQARIGTLPGASLLYNTGVAS
jgi:hypothetical protein